MTYWTPVRRVSQSFELALSIVCNEQKVARDAKLTAGPQSASDVWLPDNVYTQSLVLRHDDFAYNLSGNCYVVLRAHLQRPSNPTSVPLIAAPVYVEPVLQPGAIQPEALRDFFGPECYNLSASTRLGESASIQIELPSNAPSRIAAIGVVSAFTYGNIPQNHVVAQITFTDETGRKKAVPIKSGIHTSRLDYDFFDGEVMNHKRVGVVEHYRADHLSKKDMPFDINMYGASVDLPEDFGRLVRIEISNESPLFFDLFELVALPEPAGGGR